MTSTLLGTLALWMLQGDGTDDVAGAVGAGLGVGFMLFWLAFVVFILATFWKIFEKAGQPGWAAIVPIYNIFVYLQICGRPAWWLILAFIPLVNLILLVLPFDLAARFGKSPLFGVGLLFLGFIFFPILAWGDAEYQG